MSSKINADLKMTVRLASPSTFEVDNKMLGCKRYACQTMTT